MKQKFAWFIAGCITSWIAYCAVERYLLRPRDHSKTWQQTDRQLAPWVQESLGRKIGPMLIFTPPSTTNASAVVYPAYAYSDGLPGVYIQDENQDGHSESFIVADSEGHYISLDDEDSDGIFDSLTYNTGFGPDSYSLDDKNMDGVFDQKLGPGRDLFVNIRGNWHKLEFNAGQYFVTIDDKPFEVTAKNGIWYLAVESNKPVVPDFTK